MEYIYGTHPQLVDLDLLLADQPVLLGHRGHDLLQPSVLELVAPLSVDPRLLLQQEFLLGRLTHRRAHILQFGVAGRDEVVPLGQRVLAPLEVVLQRGYLLGLDHGLLLGLDGEVGLGGELAAEPLDLRTNRIALPGPGVEGVVDAFLLGLEVGDEVEVVALHGGQLLGLEVEGLGEVGHVGTRTGGTGGGRRRAKEGGLLAELLLLLLGHRRYQGGQVEPPWTVTGTPCLLLLLRQQLGGRRRPLLDAGLPERRALDAALGRLPVALGPRIADCRDGTRRRGGRRFPALRLLLLPAQVGLHLPVLQHRAR